MKYIGQCAHHTTARRHLTKHVRMWSANESTLTDIWVGVCNISERGSRGSNKRTDESNAAEVAGRQDSRRVATIADHCGVPVRDDRGGDLVSSVKRN